MARTLLVAAAGAVGVFMLFFYALGRLEYKHHDAFLWVLNLFASLPADVSWVLGNLLYALVMGVVLAFIVGLPIGLFAGFSRSAI